MDEAITLVAAGAEALSELKPLWEELNKHHESLSEDFADFYRARTFEDRCAEIARKGGTLRISRACADVDVCGYCISSISSEGCGEIDSLMVRHRMRNAGIGSLLLSDAMKWFGEMAVKNVVLSVYVGNAHAERFYRRHGFMPRYTVYEKNEEGK